jgi:hypothetical protein
VIAILSMAPVAVTADAGAGATTACPGCGRACSSAHPLCVEGVRAGDGPFALATLAAADRAWSTLTETLGATAPDGGLDGVWTIELVDAIDGGSDAVLVARDPIAHFDRASSRGRVARWLRPGCSLDFAVARAIARGSIDGAAPATDEASARAEAETLARLATPCATGDEDASAFQAQPEVAIVAPVSPAYERGASLFFGWLDATFATQPGGLVVGLWALAPTRTPARASAWAAQPTGFDVLRTSLKNALWDGSTLDDVFVKFAVARASMTPPARVAWHVPWPATARRLAAPVPVAPTGASYVIVDHAGAPQGAHLRVEAEWEDFGRMRWVVVKLDAAGRAIAEVPITSTDRATHASMTIESLDATDRVLVVGANVGSTEHAFDPDQGEWEPHGWLLTLGAE